MASPPQQHHEKGKDSPFQYPATRGTPPFGIQLIPFRFNAEPTIDKDEQRRLRQAQRHLRQMQNSYIDKIEELYTRLNASNRLYVIETLIEMERMIAKKEGL